MTQDTNTASGAADANYHLIDRFLRNNLYDDDYAEYSAALDALASTPAPHADRVLYDPKAVLEAFNSARAGSEKPVGYLRGILAVIAHWESRPEPHRWLVPAQADSVQEDAARYRWLAASCRSTSEHWGGRWSIVVEGPAPKSHDSEDDFDAAIDASRKQGENQ